MFTRPTLTEIVTRIKTDIVTRISGATTLLRRSILVVLSKAYGGACHLLYGNIEDNKDQLFVTTADEEHLTIHGNEYGLIRNAATKATGTVQATGTDGNTIPINTELESSTGQVYLTDAAAIISGGVAFISITAKEAGDDGNEDAGAVLSFVSPISGIDTTATIDSSGLDGGADRENVEDYRTRVLNRKRSPPHGGADFDYVVWMKEVSGVTRAWAIPLYQGVGTVGCAFVRDNDDLIPSDAEIATVRAYIISHTDSLTGKTIGIPVTAEAGLYMITLEKLSINMTIEIYPNTSTVQIEVTEVIGELIIEVGGAGQTIYKSQISEIISFATGEERHKVTLENDADYISASARQVHVLGVITYIDYNG